MLLGLRALYMYMYYIELIVTSGGENVAPVPIEDRIKKELPFLSQVFLVGEQRHFLSCLITLQVGLSIANAPLVDLFIYCAYSV